MATTARTTPPTSSSSTLKSRSNKSKSPPSPVRTRANSTSPNGSKSHSSLSRPNRTDSAFVVRRQAEIALFLSTGIVLLASLFPSRFTVSTSHTRTPTLHQHSLPAKFLFLSYEDPTTGRYLKGLDDVAIVAFWILAFTFIRVALMRWVWAPLARMGGMRRLGQIERFGEQGWTVAYNSISFACGSYIIAKSPYSLWDTMTLWRNYPFDALNSHTKLYYLVQIGFWIQQFLVLHTEARRKDHVQMFAHHCFTSILLVGSYMCNATPIGNAILVVMDPADVPLGLAKMFKYLGFSLIPDIIFVIFMIVWVITRHVLFNKLLYSATFQTPTGWNPDAGFLMAPSIHRVFVFSLVVLQIILCIWFSMIVKVAIKVIRGEEAADSRSDSEEDDEEDESSPTTPVKKSSKPTSSSSADHPVSSPSRDSKHPSPATSSDSGKFSASCTGESDTDNEVDEKR